MNNEITIRARLVEACSERGVQAKISKVFGVHPSTVKRWLEGGEITSPMLTLLDRYFFGTLPPTISALDDDVENNFQRSAIPVGTGGGCPEHLGEGHGGRA